MVDFRIIMWGQVFWLALFWRFFMLSLLHGSVNWNPDEFGGMPYTNGRSFTGAWIETTIRKDIWEAERVAPSRERELKPAVAVKKNVIAPSLLLFMDEFQKLKNSQLAKKGIPSQLIFFEQTAGHFWPASWFFLSKQLGIFGQLAENFWANSWEFLPS